MNIDIKLVSEPSIDWDILLSSFPYRKLNKSSDQCPIPLTDTARYLCAVFNISADSDPLVILKNFGHVVGQYLHYSFTVSCSLETLMNLKGYTRLSVCYIDTGPGATGLVAGTLSEWIETLCYSCSCVQTRDFRAVCNWLILFFENEGLELLFSHWVKEDAEDGTFYLRGKK